MSVVTGALASLAPKLVKLLHDEYKLQKDVKKDVEWLRDQLESINALLDDVAKVSWHQLNGEIKVWVRKVREASYDMEDALDTFLVAMVGVGSSEPNQSLTNAITKLRKLLSKSKARRDFAVAVKDIKKHVEEVAKTHQNYKQDQNIMSKPGTSRSTTDYLVPAMHKDVTNIGIDKSRDELICMLMTLQPDNCASKQEMKKLSNVGVGGLGKTTLAKVVYDKVMSEYDINYGDFVSVGRDLDQLARVFKDILFDLDKKRYHDIHNKGIGVNPLIKEIKEFLRDKRYFVVAENIKLALDDNNCGSKVITTTRMFDVAEKAGEVYKLKSLSDDDSMKLFCTSLSSAHREFLDYQPDDIVEKYLKKCAGIPLAIITMARLLAKIKVSEWCKVYGSIGFGRINGADGDTMTILSYSYFHLPPHLWTCLLYLCKYPEDYLIEKDSLIWKWIAEGFILEKLGTRLFEVGESYFRDLINTILIQREETWDGRVLGCRIHDMVLDLMRKISSEENFIAVLVDNVEGEYTQSSVRRLAHQYRIVEHIKPEATNTREPKVRSYTAIMCYIEKNCIRSLSLMHLRMLDLVHCSFEEGYHLEHLGDLVQLRYLGIRCGSSVPELRKQIGNLKLLRVLDVDTTLPATIVQLTGLVRLRAEHADAPDWIGALTSLQELRIGCVNTEMFTKELGNLEN